MDLIFPKYVITQNNHTIVHEFDTLFMLHTQCLTLKKGHFLCEFLDQPDSPFVIRMAPGAQRWMLWWPNEHHYPMCFEVDKGQIRHTGHLVRTPVPSLTGPELSQLIGDVANSWPPDHRESATALAHYCSFLPTEVGTIFLRIKFGDCADAVAFIQWTTEGIWN